MDENAPSDKLPNDKSSNNPLSSSDLGRESSSMSLSDDEIIQRTLTALNEWDLNARGSCMFFAGYMEDVFDISERKANRLLDEVVKQGLLYRIRSHEYQLTENGRRIAEVERGWFQLKAENVAKNEARLKLEEQRNKPLPTINIQGNVSGSYIGHGDHGKSRISINHSPKQVPAAPPYVKSPPMSETWDKIKYISAILGGLGALAAAVTKWLEYW